VVPARQATQPGGMGSLESFLRLLKSSKTRALVYYSFTLLDSGGKQRETVLGPVANKNGAAYASTLW
jgi:hypothetical protein